MTSPVVISGQGHELSGLTQGGESAYTSTSIRDVIRSRQGFPRLLMAQDIIKNERGNMPADVRGDKFVPAMIRAFEGVRD